MRKKLASWGKDLSAWFKGLRFGFYTMLLLAILVMGIVSVSHSVSIYIAQKQEIETVRAQLAAAKESVAKQTETIENWSDQAYIKAQARNRLFYVMPGEKQFGIINDIETPRLKSTQTSAELTEAKQHWGKNLLVSVITAGSAAYEQNSESGETEQGSAE